MNEINNNYYRISIKALILDDTNRFLLTLEENGIWELLGGGLEYGENPYDCLVRELKEEAGLEVTQVNSKPAYFVTAIDNKGIWKANLIYKVKIKNLNFLPSDECIELKFFTKTEVLREKLYPTVSEFVKIFKSETKDLR